jgi:DNA-binding transcriptional LysR family regulator
VELRHLESFLAIAEELHFGKAAARLHLTQPSLSQQLQRLERNLGVELVSRTSHEVRLTAAGEAFEVEVRRVLHQVRKAASTARDAAAGRSGTIEVGYNFPAGQHIVPVTLAKMQERYPDVGVGLREMRTGPQLAALADGKLDLALVYGRPTTPGFQYRTLMEVPLVAVVGQAHRLAGRPRVAFAELANQPCILFERDQCPAMYDAILGAAGVSGIPLNVVDKVDDPSATAILVSVRPVVGFASASRGLYAGLTSTSLRSVAVPLFNPVPAIELHAVWRSSGASPLVSAFLECIDATRPFQVPKAGPRQ